ncbi:MAG: molybdate ABC transporter substrate-binding protein [Anaerolineales bacterium]
MRPIRILIALTLLLAACTPQSATHITVFAAASLGDAFEDLARAYEAQHPGEALTVSFAGTQTLRAQIEQGAQPDVFASASPEHIQALIAQGLVAAPDVRALATNRLTVVVPTVGAAAPVTALADLAEPGVRIVMAAAEVPAGDYTRRVLAQLASDPAYGPDFPAAVLANVVSQETNIRQVVTKVRLGEADAGIVYTSDVTPDVAPSVRVIEIPPTYNVIAAYVIAPLAGAANHAGANAFVEFALSPEGQALLSRWGFLQVGR